MEIIVLTALAGVVGMGLGGIVSALLGDVSSKVMCWMLSFAGGVMVGIVCFELIPEGIELGGMVTTIMGLVLGVIVVMAFHRLLDKLTTKKGYRLDEHVRKVKEKSKTGSKKSPELLKSGIIMFVAIGLHNFPEGMAIGAAATHDMGLGIVLAVMIMLHCIPEGMAIGTPLIGGGMSKLKAVALTALTGLPTMIGGLIGMLVGGISDGVLAFTLAGAGGAMLYVVFGEILPQSVTITKSRFTTTAALIGILVGLAITALH